MPDVLASDNHGLSAFSLVVRVAEKEKGNPIVTVHDKLGRVGLEITPLKLFWERYEGKTVW